MEKVEQAKKLQGVCYDIRGKAMKLAEELEEAGHRIHKLNTGNTYPFGLETPTEIMNDLLRNLPYAQGYIESKGLFAARKAVMQECQSLGIAGVDVDDIYMGNGVSELILMCMQALLNEGDQILIPAPDYPLWSAAVKLSGGQPVYYMCDEQASWFPDLSDIEAKITPSCRALVLINPNNPTGSVYPREILEGVIEIARKHNLILFSDEIYRKITFDGMEAIPLASLADDILMVSFDGLSKSYRLPGARVGWMVLSGPWEKWGKGFLSGLDVVSSMRLCSNVPGQYAVQTALGGWQSIKTLIQPEGRLYRQRALVNTRLQQIPGLSCVTPMGALYFFPRLDERFQIKDDMQFICDFLREKKVLLVQGSGFNLEDNQHFRMTFLPHCDDLEIILDDLADFLDGYRQSTFPAS